MLELASCLFYHKVRDNIQINFLINRTRKGGKIYAEGFVGGYACKWQKGKDC